MIRIKIHAVLVEESVRLRVDGGLRIEDAAWLCRGASCLCSGETTPRILQSAFSYPSSWVLSNASILSEVVFVV